jgi:hypothetical protein
MVARQRGHHGPSRRRQRIARGIARHLGTPADALDDQMRRMNRAALARMAARIREEWPVACASRHPPCAQEYVQS